MTTATDTTKPMEQAPSDMRTEEPTFARIIGMFGGGLAILGVIAVIANQSGPRLVPSGLGYLFAAIGLMAMLFHSLRDADLESRRAYMFFAIGLLVAAVVAALIPGPQFGDAPTKEMGYHFLPWTPLFGLGALLFLVTSLRHETVDSYRSIGLTVLLALGASLCLISVALGIFKPNTLVGPGILIALLGLGYLVAFLSKVDSDDGPGYTVATMLGVLGGATLTYAIGKAVFPTVLSEGPAALKNAFQQYDNWKVAARGILVLACLGFAAWAARAKTMAGWLRAGLAIVGLGFAITFILGSLAAPISTTPEPFLVPYGLLLGGIGFMYLVVSVGITSDSPLVTLIRREISSYFYSPIAYVVLFCMATVSGVGYAFFLSSLFAQPSTLEPMLRNYWGATLGAAFGVLFLVPALTMRTLSEEKRSGTMEVLLTAPISETAIVLSKFIAALTIYMISWLPLGLYLIALRIEGGQPFDYRPIISYYLALAACGASFLAMGIFFSSLTKNQIIAAILTFAGIFVMLLTIVLKDFEGVGIGFRNVLAKIDFLSLWQSALGGQLPLSTVLVQLSLAVFWLFLTVKILEARKWG